MLIRTSRNAPRLVRSKVARLFGAVQPAGQNQVGRPGQRLQFSKERLVDFGELPRGEVPEALNYNPAAGVTTLNNGVRVGTEVYGTQLVTLGFHWNYGSRHESYDISGVTHFIQQLRLRGTATRSRADIEKTLQAVGGKVEQEIDRERNSLYITCQRQDVERVFALASDILLNSTFNENQLEAEREAVYRRIVDLQQDQLECTIENAMYTSFRDHQLGQPTLGIRENAGVLTAQQIRDFAAAHHVASNLVVTATGNVQHEQIVELTAKNFGALQRGEETRANLHQPMFTPSLMFIRDDEMVNVNGGIFFRAPAYAHPDSLLMRIFVELLGEYRADKHTGTNLNDPSRQYNTLHERLGHCTDITLQKTLYFPYSDTGVLGSYIMGNEVYGAQVAFLTQCALSDYANSINQSEVFRARAKIFNDLLLQTSSVETNRSIANDLIYLGRRVQRAEIATRISAFADQSAIKQLAKKWLYDVDISATCWGSLHNIAVYGHYNRPWKRSTLGSYGSSPGDIV